MNIKSVFSNLFKKSTKVEMSSDDNAYVVTAPEKTLTINREVIVKALNTIINWGVPTVAFITPLIFSPITSDWFDLPKQIFLLVGTLFLTVAYLLRALLTTRKVGFVSSIFGIPIMVFFIVAVVSSLLTLNKVWSFSLTVLYVGSLIAFFYLTTHLVRNEIQLRRSLYAVISSVLVMSLLSILGNVLSIAARIPQVLNSLTSLATRIPLLGNLLSPAFSPAGSAFSHLLVVASVLPIVFYLFTAAKKSRTKNGLVFPTVSLVAMVISGVFTVLSLLANRPIVLDLLTSWKVATGTLGQSLTSAIVGIGTNNYINAFTITKPQDFNLSPLWNLRFSTAGNFYFFLLTTLGIAGLASFVWIALRFVRMARTRWSLSTIKPIESGLLASASLCLIMFFIFPAPFTILFIFFMVLAILVSYYHQEEVSAFAFENRSILLSLPSTLIAVFAFGLVTFLGVAYFSIRHIFIADYYYAQSLTAAAANRGTDTYNLQIKAIALNPWNETYRVSYSQTNLALADALAGQAAGGSLTDQQRATIVQLVQQAIREARNATGLDPVKASNWENLAVIYRSLITFAQGADQWALVAQNQAVAQDPVNPRLRLDLGGLYYGLENYTAAQQAFAFATQLKPDLANAHYNLAQAYKAMKMADLAIAELNSVKTLVCANADNADCKKVVAELSAGKATEESTTSGKTIAPATTNPTSLNKLKATPSAQIASQSGELKQ